MLGEHLRTAAEAGFIERVRRLLAYGVDPNTRGYHPSLGDQTAYEVAVRHGHLGTAELLAAAGGRADRLDQVDLLLAAALAGDLVTMQRLGAHAQALVANRPEAVRLAGEQHGGEAVERLLERASLSTPPDRIGAALCTRPRCAGTSRSASGCWPGVRTRPAGTGTSTPHRPTGPPTQVTTTWPSCSDQAMAEAARGESPSLRGRPAVRPRSAGNVREILLAWREPSSRRLLLFDRFPPIVDQ